MDAQLAAFFLLYGNDIDALPYTIIDLASNTAEQAGFVPTDATDLAEVQNWPSCPGNYWYPGCSAFHGVWIATVGQITPPVLKLICTGNNVTLIQGLLYVDQNKPCADRANRVLEAAPINQTGATGRTYSGIGKALVVRIVLECYLRGKTTLFIRTDSRNRAFYTSLHFVASPYVPNLMAIDLHDAEMLLKEFFAIP